MNFKEITEEIRKDKAESIRGRLKDTVRTIDTLIKQRQQWIDERKKQQAALTTFLRDLAAKIDAGEILDDDALDTLVLDNPEVRAMLNGHNTNCEGYRGAKTGRF